MRSRSGRAASWVIPGTLLIYAGCRLLDGRDGTHGPGLWWDVGHAGFLVSWLAFAVLIVAMARTLRTSTSPAAWWAAATAGLVGVAAFVWVSVGDLFAGVPDLPDSVRTAGPVLFLVGFGALLGATARRAGYRGWVCFPALAVVAVAAVAGDLSLLPLTALLFVPALAPVRSTAPSPAVG